MVRRSWRERLVMRWQLLKALPRRIWNAIWGPSCLVIGPRATGKDWSFTWLQTCIFERYQLVEESPYVLKIQYRGETVVERELNLEMNDAWQLEMDLMRLCSGISLVMPTRLVSVVVDSWRTGQPVPHEGLLTRLKDDAVGRKLVEQFDKVAGWRILGETTHDEFVQKAFRACVR